jgi:hypothetical protein
MSTRSHIGSRASVGMVAYTILASPAFTENRHCRAMPLSLAKELVAEPPQPPASMRHGRWLLR